MKCIRTLAALVLLPLLASAADRTLKIDPARSYVDVDVKSTTDSFTAHLDAYALRANVDDKGRIKSASLTFKFSDLKTGKTERDMKMLEWLGNNEAAGKFELGILALTPDGQGQANGNLTFHEATSLVEFPVNVSKAGETYTITGEASLDYRNWNLKVYRTAFVLKVDPIVRIRFKFTGEPVGPATGK